MYMLYHSLVYLKVLDVLHLIFCTKSGSGAHFHSICTTQSANWPLLVENVTIQKKRIKFDLIRRPGTNFHLVTSNSPKLWSTFEIVTSCAEYSHNERSGFKVAFIFCENRSIISFIKNPDFSRANCFVAAYVFKWYFAMYSIVPLGSIAFSAHSGSLYSLQRRIHTFV